jgi:hypothetical protein
MKRNIPVNPAIPVSAIGGRPLVTGGSSLATCLPVADNRHPGILQGDGISSHRYA